MPQPSAACLAQSFARNLALNDQDDKNILLRVTMLTETRNVTGLRVESWTERIAELQARGEKPATVHHLVIGLGRILGAVIADTTRVLTRELNVDPQQINQDVLDSVVNYLRCEAPTMTPNIEKVIKRNEFNELEEHN